MEREESTGENLSGSKDIVELEEIYFKSSGC